MREIKEYNEVTLAMVINGDSYHIKSINGTILKDHLTFPNASSRTFIFFIIFYVLYTRYVFLIA